MSEHKALPKNYEVICPSCQTLFITGCEFCGVLTAKLEKARELLKKHSNLKGWEIEQALKELEDGQ